MHWRVRVAGRIRRETRISKVIPEVGEVDGPILKKRARRDGS